MAIQDGKNACVAEFCFEQIRCQVPTPLSPAELHALYAGTTVPRHRYLAPALVEAVNSPKIALNPAKWFSDLKDVDPSSVVGAWLRTNSDTTFEQLKCVGIDPQASQLTAALTIKQNCGYAGGTSAVGSREFVAFWVDWGSGFQYEGTASAAVFDSASRPASGLEIRVGLPVDFSQHAPAEGLSSATIKVRAVLSWNTPPSTTHPRAHVVWGNSLDLRIAISSLPLTRSSKYSGYRTGPRRGDSAFTLNAVDLADHGPSFSRDLSEPLNGVHDAASC
jgi:hypothetical protein